MGQYTEGCSQGESTEGYIALGHYTEGCSHRDRTESYSNWGITQRGVATGEIHTYRVWSLDEGRYIEVNICHLSILLEG